MYGELLNPLEIRIEESFYSTDFFFLIIFMAILPLKSTQKVCNIFGT